MQPSETITAAEVLYLPGVAGNLATLRDDARRLGWGLPQPFLHITLCCMGSLLFRDL